MSLEPYRKKRDLKTSREPKAKKAKSSENLQFVIQKHAASHLHYDFRLELDGVLKSWAIPKGPSMDPAVKRLAIEVEDHPLEYGKFEGTIPEGHYGAGTVEIWDKGTYAPVVEAKTRREQERILREGLKKGDLKFYLKGKKLKGEFALIRIRSGTKNQWLLIKKKDAYQSKKEVVDPVDNPVSHAPKAAMPHKVKPMLAYLIDESFSKEGWLFEVKWDGYRAIAEVASGKPKIYSRNLLSFNETFPPVVQALKKFDDVVFDGEIVIVDAKGRSQFQLLQNYLRNGVQEGSLKYFIFDILYYQGRDLRSLSLKERKKILLDLLKKVRSPVLQISEHIEKKGKELFAVAKKQGLEGIVAKDENSPYVSFRSKYWLKIKSHLRQEVVIAGYTPPKGSRKGFGSLVMGVYEGKTLKYVGNVGTGFSTQTLKQILAQLEEIATPECPFKNVPFREKVTWVKPKLVCEVSFHEWTKDGIMRQPSFQGMRIDKKPKSVKREKAV